MFNEMQNCTWPGWETVEMIGRGSFGSVYKIQRNIFGNVETAALKVISIPRNSGDIQEMYSDGYNTESITKVFEGHMQSIVEEYSLMRKLSGNTHIVNCDDVRYVRHTDGIGWDIFIKMELLTPLTAVLPAQIPEQMVVKLGVDMCRALELCNRHNILHRDIKPQNIFISDAGDYKLGDFGIAKTVVQTMGGTRIGTPRYMAPEVFNAQPYGYSADIYSLGLVMYWMLNEKRMPFMPLPPVEPQPGLEQEVTYRRLAGEPLPPPVHGSPELKRIVMKACAYDPRYRYASAVEMLADMQILASEHTSGTEATGNVQTEENAYVWQPAADVQPAEQLDVRQTMDFFGKKSPAGKIIDVQVGNEKKQVWIPKTLQDGQTFYYEGMGRKSAYSEKRGDLYLKIRLTPFDVPPKQVNKKKSKAPFNLILVFLVIVAAMVLLISRLKHGWVDDGGNMYYYQLGQVTTGFVSIEESKYLFDDQGVMQTGWHTIEGKKYYFADDGKMATRSLVITENGIKYVYRFDRDGALQYFDVTLVNCACSKSVEPIYFSDAYGGVGAGHYWTMASPVQNAFYMKLEIKAPKEATVGNPDGTWTVHIRGLTGEWEHAGYFDMVDGLGTFEVMFDEAKTFDAYVCTKYSGDGYYGDIVNELYEVSYRVYQEKESLMKKTVNTLGQTTKVTYYSSSGEVAAWYTSEYDENNVEQVRIIHDNLTGNEVKLVRNADGDYVIEENSGVNCCWVERKYDSYGNLASEILYDHEKVMLNRYQYDYDDAGNPVAVYSYDAAGELTDTTRTTNEYDSGEVLRYSVNYDAYPGTNPHTYRTTYTYDVEGELIGIARCENDNTIPYQVQSISSIGNYFADKRTIMSYDAVWDGSQSVFIYDQAHKHTYVYEEIYNEEGQLCMIIAWEEKSGTVQLSHISIYCYFDDNSALLYSSVAK